MLEIIDVVMMVYCDVGLCVIFVFDEFEFFEFEKFFYFGEFVFVDMCVEFV